MKAVLSLSILVSGFIAHAQSLSRASFMEPQVIYGADDRVEVDEVRDPRIRDLSTSTAAMIPTQKLKWNARTGLYDVAPKSFATDAKLCADEPFREQPVAADCSGFLVGEDLIATAGHCANPSNCKKNLWVFGYKMQGSDLPLHMSPDQVYECQEVLLTSQTKSHDMALVRLNRVVTQAGPLSLRNGMGPSIDDEVFTIGHPMGLPTKVTTDGRVRQWDPGHTYFVTNLDTYAGNSGSPVFNRDTLEVEGILVRGEDDLIQENACYRSLKCSEEGCRGEDVMDIDLILEKVRSLTATLK